MNIYEKQMKKLNLNLKQYAKLIDMPYDIVSNLVNERDEYNMNVANVLKRNLFEKHQEIEKDLDNAKLKALEIRNDDEIDYLEWYNNEYSADLLKSITNENSIKAFERDFEIQIDGKRASHWYYSCLCGKAEYQEHNIKINRKKEFVKQLYDIIVNKNLLKYKIKCKETLINDNQLEIIEWYKNFNFRKFRNKFNLTNDEIAKDLNVAYTTACQITANDYATFKMIKKVYDYVQGKEKSLNKEPKIIKDCEVEKEIFAGLQETAPIVFKNEKPEIKIINRNDEMLRKLLITRLTDEEKELIRIFGGKLD